MSLPDPIKELTSFFDDVTSYGENYWIYAIISVVGVFLFIIWMVVF